MTDERPALFKAALERTLVIEEAQRQWYSRPEAEARAEAIRTAYRSNRIESVGGLIFATRETAAIPELDPETHPQETIE